tara:strand:- start:2263 stop:3177 length:915 start_codon:yes stop_codon:yes gene_type:complete
MAKLKVDEIESTSTNTNVKISPKGTGILEAKGATNDATLQLNCSANSHGVKIKAPADSAGQNYTLILPDNQIAQDKLLKVKSITGSGATAVGQLEYADNPIPSNPTYSASNLTSGTVPSARLGSFPATSGAGFAFVQRFHPAFYNAYGSVSFSVQNNAAYRIVCKTAEVNGKLRCQLGSSTSNYYTSGYRWRKWYGYRNYHNYSTSSYLDGYFDLDPDESNQSSSTWYYFVADLFTMTGRPSLFLRGFNPKDDDTQIKFGGSFYTNSSETDTANLSRTIGAIKFYPDSGHMGYNDWAIYKYMEA